MKKLLIILGLFISPHSFSQIHNENIVECYHSEKKNGFLLIYDNIDGVIYDTLPVLTDYSCWYILGISDSQKKWLKIENLKVAPGCDNNKLNNYFEKYKDCWITTDNINIDLPDIASGSVYDKINFNLYSRPSIKSKIIFTTKDYIRTNLNSVSGNWAKITLEKNNISYTGWLIKKHQCACPWTTCVCWE